MRLGDGRRLRLGRFDALGPGAHTLDARGRVLRNRLTLKRAMERFEKLGAQLMHRTSRRVSLTAFGERYGFDRIIGPQWRAAGFTALVQFEVPRQLLHDVLVSAFLRCGDDLALEGRRRDFFAAARFLELLEG